MRADLSDAPVSDWLLGITNSCPRVPPRIARYWTIASTGQTAWVVYLGILWTLPASGHS